MSPCIVYLLVFRVVLGWGWRALEGDGEAELGAAVWAFGL